MSFTTRNCTRTSQRFRHNKKGNYRTYLKQFSHIICCLHTTFALNKAASNDYFINLYSTFYSRTDTNTKVSHPEFSWIISNFSVKCALLPRVSLPSSHKLCRIFKTRNYINLILLSWVINGRNTFPYRYQKMNFLCI